MCYVVDKDHRRCCNITRFSYLSAVTSIGTSTEEPTTSSQPLTFTTVSGIGETAAQSMTVVVRDYQALAIVLPIALLTIIINAALVGVGVFICVFLRKDKKETEQMHSNENFQLSTKSLEKSETEPERPPNSERYVHSY